MTSITFVIYRDNPADPEGEELEITGEVTGQINSAEPDVGIMSNWAEDVCFKSDDGKDYELTEAEEERAVEALCEAADDHRYSDYED